MNDITYILRYYQIPYIELYGCLYSTQFTHLCFYDPEWEPEDLLSLDDRITYLVSYKLL